MPKYYPILDIHFRHCNRVYLSLGNNLNTNVINYLLMSSDIKPDQTECKECGKSFDTTEGLEQHYELEHKWKNKKI